MHKLERALVWIVKIGLWLIPLLPLYVSSTMLFPFITGKNFTFRIIIELIFVFWTALAVLKFEYRPRLTPLLKIVTVFVGIVFLADLFSPNPYRSFFSNYERMEGFMMLGHLYLYFLMLTSVFRRRDWLVFFHVSLAASLIASYYGLLQRLGYRVSLQGGFRVDSTIGNPTYFAAYLLFHVWLLGIFLRRYGKTWWRAALYGALLLFELAMIYFTATRGVVLALALVAVPFAGALVVWWNRMSDHVRRERWSRGRKAAAGALALAIALPLVFWSVRGTEFVQKSQALRRLTNYSLREGTIQDRFMIWGMSMKGVRDRPILGWGQENYYLVFQKYYNPGLYGAEQWFDRSHNVFLDWAVHAGIPGLLAYLGVFGVFFWQIIGAMRRERGIFFEGLLLIGLFVTYFLQNLFVFDNLNSYLLFFAFLAYGEHLGRGEEGVREKSDRARGAHGVPHGAHRLGHAAAAGFCALAAVVAGGYFTILEPVRESRALIQALGAIQARASIPQVQAAFAAALHHRTFGDTEVHEQLGSAARDIAGSEGGTPEERKAFVEFALAELRKETSHPAKDVKHLLFIATILNRALALDRGYAAEAEAVATEAVRLSPTKQPAYFELAQLYLSLNRVEDGLRVLESAWRLEKNFRHAAANLWTVAIFAQKPALVAEVKQMFALADLDLNNIFNIARAYQQVNDFDHAREAYGILVAAVPANPQFHATYAALLARAGRIAEARRETEEAIRLDPNFEKEGKQFLRQLGQ